MKYRAKQKGILHKGEVSVRIHDLGDVYDIYYKGYVQVGKSFWGKFIGKTHRFDGSHRISKKELSESFLRSTNKHDFGGLVIEIKKDIKNGRIFNLKHKHSDGELEIRFDGRDPIDVIRVVANSVPLVGRLEVYKV